MSKLSQRFFVNIVSNVVIGVMLTSIFAFTTIAEIRSVSSNNDSAPYFRGNSGVSNVSIMFNVYTGTEYIAPIMEILENNNVSATFFVGGSWANSHSDVLKSIYDNGYEIGNHGYWHKDHKKLSLQRNQEEIYINHQLIKELTNFDMTLFAPPSGSYSGITLDVAANLGYKTIIKFYLSKNFNVVKVSQNINPV